MYDNVSVIYNTVSDYKRGNLGNKYDPVNLFIET